jgi:hypothetical protein
MVCTPADLARFDVDHFSLRARWLVLLQNIDNTSTANGYPANPIVF